MAKLYDPKQVIVSFKGILISGYADGTFVSAERNNDSFNLTVGSDGEGVRAKSNDRSGRVTFTLLQSSVANPALSACLLLDENSDNGDGVGPLTVTDLSGTTVLFAETAWLTKPATASFAREAEDREWVLETDSLEMLVGSN